MIHGSGSGLLDPDLERYIILAQKWWGGWNRLFSVPKWCLAVEGRSAYFWCQNGALLWRADPSLGNSFTGSGNITECSKYPTGYLEPTQQSPTQSDARNLFYNVETEVVNRRILTLEKVGLKSRGSLLRNCFTTLCFVHLR
jgi:hypothetical protein